MTDFNSFLLGFILCALLIFLKECFSMAAGWDNTMVTSYKLNYYKTWFRFEGYDTSNLDNVTAKQIINGIDVKLVVKKL